MKLTRRRAEPDAALRLAYCEPSHATTMSATHIRIVGPEGLMTGGGVPTSALCGRDLQAGWDLRTVTARTLAEVRTEYDPDWPGHVCRTCRDLARETLETQPTTETNPRPQTDDANEAAVKAARDAYRPAYEQGLASDIASCADWFGWHAAIKAARAQILREELGALRDRLDKADRTLTNLERSTPGGAFERKVRLAGKAEGVRLALSYVDEALREAQPTEEATR